MTFIVVFTKWEILSMSVIPDSLTRNYKLEAKGNTFSHLAAHNYSSNDEPMMHKWQNLPVATIADRKTQHIL